MSIHLFLESALRTLVMGVMVFAALRLLRIEQVRARRMAWLLTLAGALAMPLLVGMHLGPRLLPDTAVAGASRAAEPLAAQYAGVAAPPGAIIPLPVSAIEAEAASGTGIGNHAAALALLIYCAIAAVWALRLCAGVGIALRLRNRAQRIALPFDPRLDVRMSTRITSPVTVVSSVLLPGSYSGWDEPTLRAVLAHERAHVRQRDFYVHLLAGAHCALFWFNPFSWWLRRQLCDLGEALSDGAAVEQAESRSSYAEILLAFAARTPWPLSGAAMASNSNLTPRIERLLSDRGFERSFAAARRLPFIATGVAILALVASTSMTRADTQTIHIGRHEEGILAIRAGKSQVSINSGSGLPKQAGDYIYFQHEGRPYLIQDPGVIAQAQALLGPMEGLGQKQKDLGRQQALLRAKQRALAAKQRVITIQAPDFKRELAQLEAAMQRINLAQVPTHIDRQALKELQSHLDDLQSHLGDLQSELGEREGSFGEELGALGEQEGALGEEQAHLAEQSRKIVEDVMRQLDPIIEEAIRDGKGKTLDNY